MTAEEKNRRKKELRKEIKERIRHLAPDYCREADRQIIKQVMALPSYQKADTVFLFVGTFGEPDTRPLILDALEQGKRVCVPRCLDERQMKAYEIRSMEQLTAGSYGILEPSEGCPEVDASEIDFALIPCVTCDERRNRLGHGKGYYDRYMKGSEFTSCMVCRRLLMTGEVPADVYDIRPDVLITDEVSDVT